MIHRSGTGIVLAAIALALLTGCPDRPKASASEEQEQARSTTMERAHASVPMHRTTNFVTRETVNRFMQRTDQPDKTFYVYVMGDNANIIGYYVSRGRPVNICTFLTPPDRVEYRYRSGSMAGAVRAAPGMDGVYYGSGACDSNYFFDAATDALIEVHGLKMFLADQPLSIDAEPITVKAE